MVGIGGCVSCAVMAYSLFVLQQTGCGLPPGPSGLFGAAEGISYLYVTGLVLYSAGKKVKTGSGLPAGPGGVLGLAEGLAYLLVVAGIGGGGFAIFRNWRAAKRGTGGKRQVLQPVSAAARECFSP